MKELKIVNDFYILIKWYGNLLSKFPRFAGVDAAYASFKANLQAQGGMDYSNMSHLSW